MRRRVFPCAKSLAATIAPFALLGIAGCGQTSPARSASLPPSLSCEVASLRTFGPKPPPPQAVATPLDSAILARYALFRRAAQPDDAPPLREPTQDFILARWYPAEVRQLGERSRDARYYAIPAWGRREAVPSGCRPVRLRQELVAEQRRRLAEPVVCLLAVGSRGNGSLGCEPFAEIEADVDVFASGGATEPVVSLVPDGVASLRISYRSSPPATVPVAGNSVVFTPPPPSRRLRSLQRRAAALSAEEGGCYRAGHGPWRCGNPRLTAAQNRRLHLRFEQANAAYRHAAAAADPTQIRWLDLAGHAVRRLEPPTPAQLKALDVGNLRAPIGE